MLEVILINCQLSVNFNPIFITTTQIQKDVLCYLFTYLLLTYLLPISKHLGHRIIIYNYIYTSLHYYSSYCNPYLNMFSQ